MQAAQPGPAVSCRGLRKIYDARRRWPAGGAGAAVVAVDGLDLAIRRGECFGLLGPNGAGKTTTVEILEGHPRAVGGRGRAAGHVVGARRGPPARAHRRGAAGDAAARTAVGDRGAGPVPQLLPARAAGRRRCWPTSSWRRSATPGSASCRAASGSGWRSPARWSASPTSCSSTSRPPGWIRSRGASCGSWCCASAARAARWC